MKTRCISSGVGSCVFKFIWRTHGPTAWIPALKVEVLTSFGISMVQLHRVKDSVHYISLWLGSGPSFT